MPDSTLRAEVHQPSDQELLRQRAARYARRVADAEQDTSSVIVFERGGTRYALALEALREIRPLKSFCAIPGASAVVPGVVHYRGELLSAHDLHALLSPGAAAAAPAWFLVIEQGRERLALLADLVQGVAVLPSRRLSPAPLALGDAAAGFRGVLDDGSLVLHPVGLLGLTDFLTA